MKPISSMSTRREFRAPTGTVRAGVLFPVLMTQVDFGESARISQEIICELAPVAGRLLTPVYADVSMVFIPMQAVRALQVPSDMYAGMADVMRELLLSGSPLIALNHSETTISKAADINPISIGGVKMVNSGVAGCYNTGVNFLRLRRYNKAVMRTAFEYDLAPAIVAQTVLDLFNAVNDPDDRINGMVQLNMPTVVMPVDGIGFEAGLATTANVTVRESDNTTIAYPVAASVLGAAAATNRTFLKVKANGFPDVTATMQGAIAGNVSLDDFYKAEQRDKLFRAFDEIIEANPQYGEEMVERWVRGLSVDLGRLPVLLAERSVQFGKTFVSATDTAGVSNDTMRSDMLLKIQMNAVVPASEFGGYVVTYLTIRPDETIADQPDPFMARAVMARNYAADQLKTDPVPVTLRDIATDITAGQESTIAFYTGNNELLRSYINYGFNRLVNRTTVEAKTKVWQYEVPVSLGPNNINYPPNFPQYPFADTVADCCVYSATHTMTCSTPIVFGPTPIEQMSVTTDTMLEI